MPKPLTHDDFDQSIIANASYFVAFQFRGREERARSPEVATLAEAEAFAPIMHQQDDRAHRRPVMIYAVNKEGRDTLVKTIPYPKGERK